MSKKNTTVGLAIILIIFSLLSYLFGRYVHDIDSIAEVDRNTIVLLEDHAETLQKLRYFVENITVSAEGDLNGEVVVGCDVVIRYTTEKATIECGDVMEKMSLDGKDFLVEDYGDSYFLKPLGKYREYRLVPVE